MQHWLASRGKTLIGAGVRAAAGGIAAFVLAAGIGCGPTAGADLVVIGGAVHTSDPDSPVARAFAVTDGRFVAVGDDAEIRSHIGDNTTVIELEGTTVVPGLIDGHVHLGSGISLVRGVNLYGIADKQEWLDMIAAKATELPEGDWIVGGRWDHTLLPNAELPSKEDLDAVAPNHPVALSDVDGHSTWANSLALQLAGVTADTSDPVGGEIVRDQGTGEPTGILYETAGGLVRRGIPPLSDNERLDAVRETIAYANSLGLTGAHQMGLSIDSFMTLAERGELSLRIWYETFIRSAEDAGALPEIRDAVGVRIENALPAADAGPMFEVGYVKLVADGVLSTRTALMLQPYTDAPDVTGLPRHTQDELNELVGAVNRAGFPVAIHAIGDRAVRMSLDAFEASQSATGSASATHELPNRIEHVEVTDATDMRRFGELGVIASMNPHHCITGIDKYNTTRLGADRVALSFAWNGLRQSGATLVFGSDWDTAPLDPLEQLYAAVLREKPGGGPEGGWYPEHRLSFEEALFAYTQAPADAAGWGDEIGSISLGKRADFVVLDAHLSLPLDRGILQRSVQATYLNGTPVFTRN